MMREKIDLLLNVNTQKNEKSWDIVKKPMKIINNTNKLKPTFMADLEKENLEYRFQLLNERCFDLECKLQITTEVLLELIPISANPEDRPAVVKNKIDMQTEILKQKLLSGS